MKSTLKHLSAGALVLAALNDVQDVDTVHDLGGAVEFFDFFDTD